MTNDTIVFNHVLSNSGCMEWAALVVPRTIRYCSRHKMDFRLVIGDIDGYDGVPGHWTVPHLMLEFMGLGYKNVIYYDVDCIVADLNEDPRQIMVEDKIGAVWHDLSYLPKDLSCFSVGALYAYNSIKIREFVSEWGADSPGSPDWPWFENGTFNIIGKQRDIINKLDNRWNAGHVSPSDHMVIHGLHGFPDRLETIRARVKELDAAD